MKSRIALRIYLFCIVQFLVVFAAMEATKRIEQQPVPPFMERQARYLAVDVARVYDDRAALDATLARLSSTLAWTVEVRDESGAVVTRAVPPNLPADAPAPVRRSEVKLPLSGGRTATLAYAAHALGKPPGMRYPSLLALVVIIAGITAVFMARTLTRPLAELTAATRAFGRGRFDARTNMRRKDEIGEVAVAFDDMADRIARLLLAERELLANVSHELRTPLARIRVALDLANESEPAVAVESLANIAEDLAELERLVDDVLTAARLAHQDGSPASSPFPVRKETIAVRSLLEKSVARFQDGHPQRKLVVDLAADLPLIEGDAVLVRRVVDNLLDNANKYTTSREAKVELRAKTEGEEVVIEVADEGVGITEADLGRVFEPFFRSDRSRTRATGGLGLGLALVKRVVDAHRGTIHVDSQVGVGTTVRVRMPVATASDRSAA